MKLMRTTLIFAAGALLLSACHSTRKSAVRTEPTTAAVWQAEKRGTEQRVERKEAGRLEKEARRWLGTPYKYGGQTRKGTDCSGMVMTVFEEVTGIKLPRDSRSQQEFCIPVTKKELSAGDLVFFSSSKSNARVSHVGLYIGNGEFIHASSSRGVIISRLDEPYYVSHYHSGGRVPALSKGKAEIVKETPVIELPIKELPVKEMPVREISVKDVPADTTASPTAPAEMPTGLADSIRSEVRRAMRF